MKVSGSLKDAWLPLKSSGAKSTPTRGGVYVWPTITLPRLCLQISLPNVDSSPNESAKITESSRSSRIRSFQITEPIEVQHYLPDSCSCVVSKLKCVMPRKSMNTRSRIVTTRRRTCSQTAQRATMPRPACTHAPRQNTLLRRNAHIVPARL